nr:hypothetical protein [Clostridia bacterium]
MKTERHQYRYKVNRDEDTNDEWCPTHCPNERREPMTKCVIGVGSALCHRCRYFIKDDTIKQIVTCRHPKRKKT